MGNKKQKRITLTMVGIALIAVVILFVVLNLKAESQNPGVAADAENGRDNDTLRVTLQSAKDSFDAGEALMVDVRSSAEFESSHIPDAVLIPLNEIDGSEPDVPKDALIFTYCT
ncbi:MAG: rhodanese-like domain-containing protein [Pelolinea sp.]|nr:rhodanese-like domain-containing protein [Pelolinea sp.]